MTQSVEFGENSLPPPYTGAAEYPISVLPPIPEATKPSAHEASSGNVEAGLFKKAVFAVGRAGMLGAAVGAYAYEQSPENEALRGRWGVRTIQKANDILSDIDPRMLAVGGKALMVGAVVAGITMAVETISGTVTAATMSRKEGVLGRFNNFITRQAKKLETLDKDGNPKGDIALGLAGGASLIVVKREAESGEDRTFRDNAKTATKASAGIAAFSGTLSAATTALIDTSDLHGYTTESMWVLDRVADGKTWWGVYGSMILLNRLGKLSDVAGQKAGAWYYSRHTGYFHDSYRKRLFMRRNNNAENIQDFLDTKSFSSHELEL